MGEGVGRRQNVIGVKDADDIASRKLDALIDRVVHSLVSLGDPLEGKVLPPRLSHFAVKIFDRTNCIILAAAVDDNIFQIYALLRQDTIKASADCRSAIVTSCNQ